MPRSGHIKVRKSKPDFLYNDILVGKMINRVMKSGKKTIAEKVVYGAIEKIKEKTNQDGILIFRQGLDNVKPQMEVRSRRIGGAAYQVPTPVKGERKESLAIRWVIMAAKKRPSKDFHTFSEKLAVELIDAFNNQGGAIKKKEDTHRMAEANKAFAHFKW